MIFCVQLFVYFNHQRHQKQRYSIQKNLKKKSFASQNEARRTLLESFRLVESHLPKHSFNQVGKSGLAISYRSLRIYQA